MSEFVNATIRKARVVIFTKTCPYCTMAKETFDKMDMVYLTIELQDRPDCNEIQDALEEITGARSVPRVFVDGKFIGGGTEVKKMYEDGSLAKLLETKTEIQD